jgi:hypothetical protein
MERKHRSVTPSPKKIKNKIANQISQCRFKAASSLEKEAAAKHKEKRRRNKTKTKQKDTNHRKSNSL